MSVSRTALDHVPASVRSPIESPDRMQPICQTSNTPWTVVTKTGQWVLRSLQHDLVVAVLLPDL